MIQLQPGIYSGMSMSDYLATPALSASLIKLIDAECPAKAWAASYLNPAGVIDTSDAADLGTIAHAILLEGGSDLLVVIDPRDHPAEKTGAIPIGWTNKSIRAARDMARAAGKIPILADAAQAVKDMVAEAQTYIESVRNDEPAIWAAFQGGGVSEDTVIWREGQHPCKIRPDRRSGDWGVIVDYKTTARSSEPDAWGRSQLLGMGYYLSACWYRRGVKAATGIEPDYVFLAQSTEPPYLCSLVGCNPGLLAIGDAKVADALETWKRSVDQDYWPAYVTRVCYPDTPAWLLASLEEAEIRDIMQNGMPGDRGRAEIKRDGLTIEQWGAAI
jgi:hypothetical protein